MTVFCKSFWRSLFAGGAVTLALLGAMPATAVEEGEPAPDFTLPGVRASDAAVQLSELQGKVVYVDFWASWCLPCLRSLPQINGLYEQYRDQGFEVVAITIDDPVEDATEFLEDLEVPLAYSVVLDATADVMDQYRVVGMPTSFLIDRDGVIRKVHKGFREGDTELLEQALIPLLAE
ncbi:TlpA family protein disulfide reductase [Pseudohongiella sp.]|uniref:Thioredoxin domain-containing protein n=1 Tax=marine sediment metagenome TaxID=412755 RepID=A0A0F9VK59_9ZZZZ|nr:TlpA disulfide reductase family protein [Pseudohongiella sp.]